jgi:nitroreductase
MLSAIKKRRSFRSFKSDPVEEEKIEAILQATQMAPSANHKRPWQFWLVKNKIVLEKLSQATPWGSFIAQAPLAIVVCADESLSGHWLEDASIVGAYIYLEATNQGLGTCWVQNRDAKTAAGKNSEDYIGELLGVPQGLRVIATFPIGYPIEIKEAHNKSDYQPDKVHVIE